MESYFSKATVPFDPKWISSGADDAGKMIKFADEAGGRLADKNGTSSGLSRSKIRSIYGEIKRIQSSGFASNHAAFFLLKPKVAYAYGRTLKKKGGDGDKYVYWFREIFERAWDAVDVNTPKTYDNFCNLMEAILAYHRVYGGQN